MRDIPEGLAGRLASETTTLAHCWRLARVDGTVMGFTDHDCDIAFGGVTYVAASALTAAERAGELGFAIGGGEVSGVLDADALTAGDIAAGRYDGARVEVWLVDWSAPGHRMLLDVGEIGEVRRRGVAFEAELRSVAHRLDETRGRIYGRMCDADLGDARCGLVLEGSPWVAEGVVTAPDGDGFRCSGLEEHADGWFTDGRLTWTSGASVGLSFDVKAHRAFADGADLRLWTAPLQAASVGDSFTVTAGCDRSFAACRDRFANIRNFRGFPHMPGNDFAIGAGGVDGPMDGGSMFR